MAKSQHEENALGGHASRRPASSSTVVSRPCRRLQEEHPCAGNTVSKLMRREIGGGLRGRSPPRPDAAFGAEMFRCFKLQEEFDVYADDMEHPAWMMMMRSVTRIVSANEFFFVISSLGICVAFRQTASGPILPCKKDGRIRYFNRRRELVEVIFYNKINDSVIIVSSMLTSSTGYYMRALPLESIRTCDDWDNGVSVLGSWANSLPFLDDCNNIAVVSHLSPTEPVNRVYEINTYTLVHYIARKIHSMSARPGVVIAAYEFEDYLPIEVFSTENWRVLKRFNYSMPPCKELEFIKICKENIFYKESGKNMKIVDIWNHDNVNVIEHTKHKKNLLSFDLTANKILLRFNDDIIVTSNYFGGQVSLLEDNEMPGNSNVGYQLSDIHVTRDKSHAIYYSRKKIEKPRQGADGIQASSSIGSINVYRTFSGKPIVNINTWNDLDLTIATRKEGDYGTANIQSSVDDALMDVTAVFYDEKHHRIYTGSRRGFVHVWSN